MNETVVPRVPVTDGWLDRFRDIRSLPVILLVAALVLTYGYEVFSFNLTIDEDSTSTAGRFERAGWSVAEGRWGMALLTLFLSNPIAPVVSNGLGIALSGVAWWFIARRLLTMPAWHAAFAAALGGTIPVLAFIFSFSTIAFAIGIGNLLLVVFFVGLGSRSWWLRAVAVLAAATAIGVYDTFLVAIAAVALGLVVKRPNFVTVALALGGTVLSLVVSRVVGAIVSFVVNEPQTGYTGAFFDFAGLLDTPRLRAESAAHDVWGVVSLSTERFAISSPWLAISVIVILIAAVYALVVITAPLKERIIRIVAVVALLALPYCVEAVASIVVLRSMFYLPIVLIVLASVASTGIERMTLRPRLVVESVIAVAVVLAVVGNATVANRSFSIAATTYSLDTDLAFDIGQQKDRLLDGDNLADLPVVVSGVHSWPEGAFTTTRETLGLSLFGFNPSRTSKFLRAHGVLVHEASKSQVSDAQDALRGMPEYPQPGWVALDDGVLILNFGTESEPAP
jgi:hypothetical protein